MAKFKDRRRYFKREARFILRCNYPRQALMGGLLLLVCAGLNALCRSLVALAGLEYSYYALPLTMFFDLLMLLLIIPLYAGLLAASERQYEGERPAAGALLEYFSSPSALISCYRIAGGLILRAGAFFLPFLFFGSALSRLSGELSALYDGNWRVDLTMSGICLAYFAALAVCALIMMRYFAVPYLFIRSPYADAGELARKSALLMIGHKIEAFAFLLSFAPLAALSLFTGGLLFILYTLPYMSLSYIAFASNVYALEEGDSLMHPMDEILEEFGRTV